MMNYSSVHKTFFSIQSLVTFSFGHCEAFFYIFLGFSFIFKSRDESFVDNMKSPFNLTTEIWISLFFDKWKQSAVLVDRMRCIYFASCLSKSDHPHLRERIRSSQHIKGSQKSFQRLDMDMDHFISVARLGASRSHENCLFDQILTLLCSNKAKRLFTQSLVIIHY